MTSVRDECTRLLQRRVDEDELPRLARMLAFATCLVRALQAEALRLGTELEQEGEAGLTGSHPGPPVPP